VLGRRFDGWRHYHACGLWVANISFLKPSENPGILQNVRLVAPIITKIWLYSRCCRFCDTVCFCLMLFIICLCSMMQPFDGVLGQPSFSKCIFFCSIWICKLIRMYFFNFHVCTQASYGEPQSHLQVQAFPKFDSGNSICSRIIYVDCAYMILCSWWKHNGILRCSYSVWFISLALPTLFTDSFEDTKQESVRFIHQISLRS
jgi:hypothetical protein